MDSSSPTSELPFTKNASAKSTPAKVGPPPSSTKPVSTKTTSKKSEIPPKGPTIKSSPINPAWASEVAKAYGFAGSLADAVADQLVDSITEHLAKLTTPQKLTKLVKTAAISSIGKF